MLLLVRKHVVRETPAESCRYMEIKTYLDIIDIMVVSLTWGYVCVRMFACVIVACLLVFLYLFDERQLSMLDLLHSTPFIQLFSYTYPLGLLGGLQLTLSQHFQSQTTYQCLQMSYPTYL